MPDGERVTTGSEPRRPTKTEDGLLDAIERLNETIDRLRAENAQLRDIAELRVVEPGHDEQTEDLKARLREAEAELQQVDAILELADTPTEEYAAQAGGMVTFTRAGRVNWLRHRARGVLEKDTGPAAERSTSS